MKLYLKAFALGCLFLALLTSCDDTKTSGGSGGNGGSTSNAMLPPARGDLGEMILIVDTAIVKGSLQESLDGVFDMQVPGVGSPESYFTVRTVSPVAMNSTLRAAHILVYVATLDNQSRAGRTLLSNFTENSIDLIKEDPNKFYSVSKDRFARNQTVLFLYGQNAQVLAQNLRDNKEVIQDLLVNKLEEQVKSGLYKAGEVEGLGNLLLQERGYTLRVPFAWDLAKKEEDFVWIRRLDQQIDKSVWIYSTDYVSEAQFAQQSILAMRVEAAKGHIFDVQKPEIYMETQDREDIPVQISTKQVNFAGTFAVEMRGLWRLSDYSRGGPFLSYTIADPEAGKLYYIEGYVDSPGKDKLPSIMELEVILKTFRTQSMLGGAE